VLRLSPRPEGIIETMTSLGEWNSHKTVVLRPPARVGTFPRGVSSSKTTDVPVIARTCPSSQDTQKTRRRMSAGSGPGCEQARFSPPCQSFPPGEVLPRPIRKRNLLDSVRWLCLPGDPIAYLSRQSSNINDVRKQHAATTLFSGGTDTIFPANLTGFGRLFLLIPRQH